MPALLSEPNFCLTNAAAPQRVRPGLSQKNIDRLSIPGLYPYHYHSHAHNLSLDESYYICNKKRSNSVADLNNQLQKSSSESNNSLPEMLLLRPASLEAVPTTKSLNLKPPAHSKSSFTKLLKKLLFISSKKSNPSPKKFKKNKASDLFDQDDGLLDDDDVKIGAVFIEGGLPLELATTNLHSTYISSIRKLKVKSQRPLSQVIMINSIVSRLKSHVSKYVPEADLETPSKKKESYQAFRPNLDYKTRPRSNLASRSQHCLRRHPSMATPRPTRSEGDLDLETIKTKTLNRYSSPYP